MTTLDSNLFPHGIAGAIADVGVSGKITDSIFSYPESILRILGGLGWVNLKLTTNSTPPANPDPYTVWVKRASLSGGTVNEMEVAIYNPATSAFEDPARTLWAHAMGLVGLQGDPGANGAKGDTGADGAAGAGYAGVMSSSSVAIGEGAKTLNVNQRGAFGVGSRIRASSSAAPADKWMEGVVTAVTASSMTVSVDLVKGSGTVASWNISIAGEPVTTSDTPPVLV